MDLPIGDFMGKKNNNIVIRTVFCENDQKYIIKISNCTFILEDNYNLKNDSNYEDQLLKHSNVTYNQIKYNNLKDFVVKFVEYQKTQGWKYELSYKSINHCDCQSSYSKNSPLFYYKDEYLITFFK